MNTFNSLLPGESGTDAALKGIETKKLEGECNRAYGNTERMEVLRKRERREVLQEKKGIDDAYSIFFNERSFSRVFLLELLSRT